MCCAFSPVAAFLSIILVAIVWTIFWKAIGLWYAARNGDKIWFVIFILVNIVGIPEIVYLNFRTDFFKKLKVKKSKKK